MDAPLKKWKGGYEIWEVNYCSQFLFSSEQIQYRNGKTEFVSLFFISTFEAQLRQKDMLYYPGSSEIVLVNIMETQLIYVRLKIIWCSNLKRKYQLRCLYGYHSPDIWDQTAFTLDQTERIWRNTRLDVVINCDLYWWKQGAQWNYLGEEAYANQIGFTRFTFSQRFGADTSAGWYFFLDA